MAQLDPDTVTARTNAAPYVQRWHTTLQQGHPSCARILKPGKFAVRSLCNQGSLSSAYCQSRDYRVEPEHGDKPLLALQCSLGLRS
jgi:hypothetical protein